MAKQQQFIKVRSIRLGDDTDKLLVMAAVELEVLPAVLARELIERGLEDLRQEGIADRRL